MEVARRFIELPTLSSDMDSVREICRLVGDIAPGSATHRLLEAQTQPNLPSEAVVQAFVLAADLAKVDGDPHIEAVATYRAIQAANNHDPLPPHLVERMGSLAPVVPFASGVFAHIRSQLLQADGDGRGAMEAIGGTDHLANDILMVSRAERFCDLGWPERVFTELHPDDLADLPEGAEIFAAFAMWLRGEVTPEEALVIGSAMIPEILARGALQPTISILSVVTHIAIAAGELNAASNYGTRLSELCTDKTDVRTRLFSAMATAAIASAQGDEQAAAAALDSWTTRIPYGMWPARPHLLGIPLLYLVCPEARSMLNACWLGPSLSTAVAAGRALVDLRETGSTAGSIALPWSEPLVLRAHILPHHLCELAATAASEGNELAGMLLDGLPTRKTSLTRLAVTANPKLSNWAAQQLSAG